MSDLYVSSAMYCPKPYVMFGGEPNATVNIPDKMSRNGSHDIGETTIKFNEFGFRIERDLLKKKERGEIRIFLVGGSTVFHGSTLSNCISGQVEKLFHNDGRKNIQVSNFGVPSYVSGQELSLMLHVLPDFDPDLIVIYDGGNDVTAPCYFEPRPGYPYNFMVNEFLLKSLQGNGSGALSIEVKRNLDMESIRAACGYTTEGWELNIVTEYVGNVRKMFRIARGFGFQLCVFLQPLIAFKEPLIGNEPNIVGVPAFQEYIHREYIRIRSLFSELQESDPSTRERIIDLSMIFANYHQETFWDYIHIDNTGNRHVADQIYRHLRELI